MDMFIEMDEFIYKSVNTQYKTLGCWVVGPNDSSTKRLMFQVLLFFNHFLDLGHTKLFVFILYFFFKIKE